MEHAILGYYEQVAAIHGMTGLVGKLSAGLAIGALALGAKQARERLVPMILAVHFFLAAWTAAGFAMNPVYAKVGSATLPVAVICFAMAAIMGYLTAKPDGVWTLAHAVAWRRAVAWAVIAWAFYYPVFGRGWTASILYAPMGVLPQPTLLIGGALAWIGLPNTSRLAGWALTGGLVALAVIDLAAGVQSSWLLLVLGLVLGGELVRSVMKSGGMFEDDVPDVEKERFKRERVTEETKPGKVWKLK